MNQKKIENKLIQLKNQPYPSFILSGAHNEQLFHLQFLTHDVIDNNQIVHLLSEWRKKHESWFPTQFPISDERTRLWLKKHVMDIPDRLLFLLSVQNLPIGHIGLFRFDWGKNSCEIDNIVRGVDIYPGIMQSAISTMMDWGKKELQITNYTLETTSDNLKAIQLYTKLGFKEKKRIPLVYKKTDDGGEWVEVTNIYKGSIKRYHVYMELSYI